MNTVASEGSKWHISSECSGSHAFIIKVCVESVDQVDAWQENVLL